MNHVGDERTAHVLANGQQMRQFTVNDQYSLDILLTYMY